MVKKRCPVRYRPPTVWHWQVLFTNTYGASSTSLVFLPQLSLPNAIHKLIILILSLDTLAMLPFRPLSSLSPSLTHPYCNETIP